MSIFGFFLACFAGLIGGLAPAPLKGVKKLEYEHWGLLVGLFGYLVFPWTFLLCVFPDAVNAIAELPLKPLLIGNAFSLAWGVANILYLICMVKIGFCLAQGLLVGIAIPAGVLIPMALKGSGKFANAPDIFSTTGLFIVISVLMMLVAVFLLSKAGFGREKALAAQNGGDGVRQKNGKGFATYLGMSILAGILSIGISFSFVYTESLISEVFAKHGMNQNFTPAAVRTVTLTGGGFLNVIYPLFLLVKNKSWGGFACEHGIHDMAMAIVVALVTTTSVVMASTSMVLLGALGSSVGFGVGQAMQLVGSQCVAFLSHEWWGVPAKYIRLVVIAMALLFAAVGIISVLS